MPGFLKPLAEFVRLGHTVDAVAVLEQPVAVKQENLERLGFRRLELVRWSSRGAAHRLRSMLRLYCRVSGMISRDSYDFVYGHGSVGTIANLVALRAGLPCGCRLYGTKGLAAELSRAGASERGRWRVFWRHPLQVGAFLLRKDFLLVTDDGSRADEVHEIIGRARYQFHFWRNGVDAPPEPGHLAASAPGVPGPYLLMPGRVAPKKQQHLALDLLRELDGRTRDAVKLLIVGHVTDSGYHAKLLDRIVRSGLEKQVEFLGPQPPAEVAALAAGALAVLSLQRVSNLGNVALETVAQGAVLITLADGSLDFLVENGVSGFLVRDMSDAASAVVALLEDPDLRDGVGSRAKAAAHQRLGSWQDRVAREVDLVTKSVEQAKRR